jgi:DOPA 4,5-dioxygenase
MPMTVEVRNIDEIASYHAHVYFHSPEERETAQWLRSRIAERFRVRLGRWHEVAVGPHSGAMYQVAFETALFAELVPWLMINHASLSVLVHPNTTNPRRDHLEDALWLGKKLALFADKLPAEQEVADEAGEPNTDPTVAPLRE